MYKSMYHCTGPHPGRRSSSAVIGASLSSQSSTAVEVSQSSAVISASLSSQSSSAVETDILNSWVHVTHGRMHPNQDHVTDLFAMDPLSLCGYLTVSSTHPVTDI